ncbi:LTA synthase family protein [Shewanella gaetbuli]
MKNRSFYYYSLLLSLSPFLWHFFSGLPNNLLPTIYNTITSLTLLLIIIVTYTANNRLGFIITTSVITCISIIYIGAIEYYRFYKTFPTSEIFYMIGDSISASSNIKINAQYIWLVIYQLSLSILAYKAKKNLKLSFHISLISFLAIIFSITIINKIYITESNTPTFIEQNPEVIAFEETPVSIFVKSAIVNTDKEEIIRRLSIAKLLKEDSSIDFEEKSVINQGNSLYKIDTRNGLSVKHNELNNSYMPESINAKNIILIVLESIRTEELTDIKISPNLFKLQNNSNTIYFENFFSTNITTVKSEQAILCSTPEVSNQVPFSVTDGNFLGDCLPKKLRKNNISTYWFHGNTDKFFNRSVFHKSLGFEYIYGKEFFIENGYSNDNDIGWGAPDKFVLSESLKTLERSRRPFFAQILTLTNHMPFDWDYPEFIPLYLQPEETSVYDNYLKGVYYTDYAFGAFFEEFKRSELHNNTMLIITGDHGVQFYKSELSEIRKTEILYRVPLYIYHKDIQKNLKVKNNHSHLDVAPTILSVLNIEESFSSLGLPLYGKHASDQPRPIFLMNMLNYSFKYGDFSCYQYDGSCQDNHNSLIINDVKEAYDYLRIMQLAAYKDNY